MTELNSNEPAALPAVSRIVVVGDQGKEFEEWDLWAHGVKLHLQDDGRTLKVFPLLRLAESECLHSDVYEDGLEPDGSQIWVCRLCGDRWSEPLG